MGYVGRKLGSAAVITQRKKVVSSEEEKIWGRQSKHDLRKEPSGTLNLEPKTVSKK